MSAPKAFYNQSGDPKELVYHLKIKKGDIAPYVLLPGDPKRCAKIAEFLDDAQMIADYREYVTITGTYKGVPISVCSTGIGGPSASIAVEELITCGAHTFIRVGTSGGLKLNVLPGQMVIAQAAVRDEGTAHQYMPPEVPARANYKIIKALQLSAEKHTHPFHIGIVHSKDAFYTELEPENAFFREREEQKLHWYTKAGVLCSEMEAAAIFTVAMLRKVRAGGIFEVVEQPNLKRMNVPTPQAHSIETVIQTALDALVILAKEDEEANHE